MLPKWCFALIAFYDTIRYNIVETCSCQKYTYNPYLSRIDYLVRLPHSKKIRDLALIGTHSSFSYIVDLEKYKTQDLNIIQQLKYGVRVFDIGVRPQSNLFVIYVENVSTHMEFPAVVMIFNKFLDDHPGEMIFINVYQVYSSTPDVTRSNCDIMNYYIDNTWGGWRLIKKWQLNHNIGMYRGKILLASMDHSFSNCTFNLNRNCEIQNDDFIVKQRGSIDNIESKWANIVFTMRIFSPDKDCIINDISYGKFIDIRRAVAKDGGYDYTYHCINPFNHRMAKYFRNLHSGLTIVFADFPTQELMDKVNDSNFPNKFWRFSWE